MIIPSYNINDIPYHFDFDDRGIAHSYPNEPPGYSTPQILYSFHYDGFMTKLPIPKNYKWEVNHPFYILSGQNTSNITCELMPKLVKNREDSITGLTQLNYTHSTITGLTQLTSYKYTWLAYCELNLEISSSWKETLNLYYKQGPLWKIEGNKIPKLNSNSFVRNNTNFIIKNHFYSNSS